jgi:hypothetical protein
MQRAENHSAPVLARWPIVELKFQAMISAG